MISIMKALNPFCCKQEGGWEVRNMEVGEMASREEQHQFGLAHLWLANVSEASPTVTLLKE